MVYKIKERDDGNGPDVQMLKIPSDVLYKTINNLQEPVNDDEDNGVDVQKLLSKLQKRPKVNKKKERQKNMILTLKNLVRALEKEYDPEDTIEANDKNDDNEEESMNYYM